MRRKYFFHTAPGVSRRSGGSISAPVHMKNTGTAKRARLSPEGAGEPVEAEYGKELQPVAGEVYHHHAGAGQELEDVGARERFCISYPPAGNR